MHSASIEPWGHEHVFLGVNHARNERRTWIVIGLTVAMMGGEIAAGVLFGSMALLADGFHMATHAGALAITALAYLYARRYARDARFTFGTGKLGELAGYSSAIILAIISLLIGFESILRLAAPVPIRFDEAITVAVLGLIVNLASAWLLHDGDHHGEHEHRYDDGAGTHARSHGRDSGHKPLHEHHDHNLRAAYAHVLADALTSVFAIIALFAGQLYGWIWMDPLMGIVGSLVIARWSWSLLKNSGRFCSITCRTRRWSSGFGSRLSRMTTGFPISTYGGLVPVIWRLSFRSCHTNRKLLGLIRKNFRRSMISPI